MKKIISICILFVIFSCARQGLPTGGKKDILPPKLLKSIPDTLSKNIPTNLKEIRLFFNELLIINDPTKQIIISPPIEIPPDFLPNAYPDKEIRIKFKEKLKENTTYSINFGESIKDNNEGNILSNFKYIFSTGNFIDSLKITGKISNYFDNKLDKNTIIGLYKNDSVINYLKKPYYISKIDTASMYHLTNLKEGNYKIIAFNDLNFNKIFDEDTEQIGFIKNQIKLDSSQIVDLKLSKVRKKYKIKDQKQDGFGKLKFTFKGMPDEIKIIPLEPKIVNYKIDHQKRIDSAYFWFNPKELDEKNKNTKMRFIVENNDKKDTVSLFYNSKEKSKLGLVSQSKTLLPNELIYFEFNNPINKFNPKFIKITSNKQNVDFQGFINNKNQNKIELKFPIKFDSRYDIEFLPKAIEDYFGNSIDSTQISYQTKNEREFGNLELKIINKPKTKFFLELLGKNNEMIKNIYSNDDYFKFNYLLPGEYSFRILVDENENEFYDFADFINEIPAEKTVFYTKKILIRAFWDISETWELKE